MEELLGEADFAEFRSSEEKENEMRSEPKERGRRRGDANTTPGVVEQQGRESRHKLVDSPLQNELLKLKVIFRGRGRRS